MKSKVPFYIITALFLAFNTYAQKKPVKKPANKAVEKADAKYSEYAYIDAIKTYEQVAEKGYKSVDMFKKLANACYFNSELEKAAKWYGELFAMTTDVEPEYYYRYSQSLKSVGQYAKADEMLAKFLEKSSNDSRAELYAQNKNYLEEIKANSGRYRLSLAEINSIYSDYGSFVSENKLIFTSARDTGNFVKRKDKWTNQYFTNTYFADIKNDSILGTPKKFDQQPNTKFHDATPIITKDGKTMYFTRNSEVQQKILGKEKERLLKIYKAEMVDGKWKDPVELPFNGPNYNVAYPALSPDEKTLYFASNMPGTIGQSDLYKVRINEDGSFGKPENLGSEINTEGKENFPFVSADNYLYFASDGRPGLGGLDIFAVKIAKDGSLKKIQNVGEPANSQKDDFAYYINSKTRLGFLSSNRDNGKGSDDIYKFLETRKLNCEQELSGIVTDKETGIILPNAKVFLFDTKFNLIKEVLSDDKGNYAFLEENDVECGENYYIRALKEDYNAFEQKISIAEENGKTEFPIQLEKTACKVAIGDDLGTCFGIKMIYFDFNKAIIRYEAAFELEKILDVMKKNPTMKIDVRSHTDSRGSAKYNETLSHKRSKATVDWLVKNGIERNRLTAKGYGESQLINKCADGVECTEDEHQQNRRSQFIILSF